MAEIKVVHKKRGTKYSVGRILLKDRYRSIVLSHPFSPNKNTNGYSEKIMKSVNSNVIEVSLIPVVQLKYHMHIFWLLPYRISLLPL